MSTRPIAKRAGMLRPHIGCRGQLGSDNYLGNAPRRTTVTARPTAFSGGIGGGGGEKRVMAGCSRKTGLDTRGGSPREARGGANTSVASCDCRGNQWVEPQATRCVDSQSTSRLRRSYQHHTDWST